MSGSILRHSDVHHCRLRRHCACGSWVTDSDDILDPDFLCIVPDTGAAPLTFLAGTLCSHSMHLSLSLTLTLSSALCIILVVMLRSKFVLMPILWFSLCSCHALSLTQSLHLSATHYYSNSPILARSTIRLRTDCILIAVVLDLRMCCLLGGAH